MKVFLFTNLFSSIAMFLELAIYYFIFKSFDKITIGEYSLLSTYILFFMIIFDGQLASFLIKTCKGKISHFNQYIIDIYKKRKWQLSFVFSLFIIILIAPVNVNKFLLVCILFAQILSFVEQMLITKYKIVGEILKANQILALSTLLKFIFALIFYHYYDNLVLVVLSFIFTKTFFILMLWKTNKNHLSENPDCYSLLKIDVKNQYSLQFNSFFNLVLTRIDWILVSYFLSLEDLAIYSFAIKIFETAKAFFGLIITNLLPLAVNNDVIVDKYYKLTIFSSIFFFIILFFNLDFIFNLFDNKFNDSKVLFFSIIFIAPLSLFVSILYQKLLINNLINKVVLVSIICSLIQFVFNYLFIPNIGILSGVLSIGLSWLIMVFYCVYLLKWKL